MAKNPDRLYIDKDKDRKLYNALEEEIFKGTTRKEQFFFAMAYGFLYDIRIELSTKDNWFLVKDMGPEDESIIYALAIAKTNSVGILANKAEVYKIAEEYAHGGIKLLHDEVTSKQPGSFYKRFEKTLFDKLSNYIEETN